MEKTTHHRVTITMTRPGYGRPWRTHVRAAGKRGRMTGSVSGSPFKEHNLFAKVATNLMVEVEKLFDRKSKETP